MIDKLREIKKRYEAVRDELAEPEVMSDMKAFAKLSKEYKDLEKIVVKYDAYDLALSNLENAKAILQTEKDPEFRDLTKAEISELEPQIETLEEELKTLLIPKDPNDDKNALLEIRGGTGGDEAAIFAGDLYRMYQRFAEKIGWKFEVMSATEGTAGGYKEIIVSIEGEEVYAKLKFESGVHRVQRVPDTETQGRVHTSAATVAVLPEDEDVEVELNMSDIKKDTFRASGAGGQHVNKTESAIRLTHLPTGVVVECQAERSQIKNYERALKVLKARLYDLELQKKQAETSAARKSLVRSGDRSEKIRTYNYPQGRVTDHRINFSVFNLPMVMNGEIEEFIEKLRIAENAEKMANSVKTD
ncbi:peptide chain release factor 1 [Hugenholtzia roseola]|uniref:peptide chain release factor 1 n=1 Tax=Hugenholtzia roseola TaxID=1002 RepID=UPI00040C007D|nr:peptide chain release factor 1 [Hugenholtzia roseola]